MIKVLDLHFLDKSDTIAAFLAETSAGPILFETGPYSTFSHLKAGLAAQGYQPEDIAHVFITHIHLDHAGAAWAMAEAGATIYLHPFGQAHMHDPSKLVASATRIYGDDMERLWSTMKGIPAAQLKTVDHEDTIKIGDTEITAWHTPGHAVHHIAWQVGSALIAGDVAGVKIGDAPVVPPCPPPDINVEDWQASLNLIRQLPLQAIYLTHYGRIAGANIPVHLDELEQELLAWAEWMKPHFEAGSDPKSITPEFMAWVQDRLTEKGVSESMLEIYENANPSWMSVAGLLRYWKKRTAG
ncbi:MULTISPECIES: MBL fold metallo-hydrolase [Phaeodactylibacter]|jgi:glyoxylase-like metal-dependent hydrolase (beta-lactamase superfamily II)|uniref:Metallo-beta-lactamase n=1 Tax=Phaeodactylibacter xiamenensis TaxID=1524460 RepID=A0A098S233_9BACT|nr:MULTISPECIES: MBL fold metallo-hydrolase [Phaeodactylibacter]KGE86151.1 metallo-beta-lactamase [Phaeodactylibacter xiamenensis]MCI4649323.1 MBL fold metallo-hydrolase [Phaeodactylibacter sp.]MCI5090646.1 MBL fold metallo-hydrolase [Phaeodactylibacter sp.]MCR9052130.1 MBL fold metallo-hydrolase [bacterium]